MQQKINRLIKTKSRVNHAWLSQVLEIKINELKRKELMKNAKVETEYMYVKYTYSTDQEDLVNPPYETIDIKSIGIWSEQTSHWVDVTSIQDQKIHDMALKLANENF